MRRDEKEIRKILDQSLAAYRDLSQEEIGVTVDRVWENVRPGTVNTTERVQRLADSRPARPAIARRRSQWRAVAAIAAAIAIAVLVPVKVLQRAPAELEDVGGSRKIKFGEAVRSNGGVGETLVLADGSRVEMRSESELLLERADDGVRIRLRNGGIIVNAAKQRHGHLYVQTKDVTVSVVGTVFLVNAEEEGSRVSVIEGEVRVQQQGVTEKKLRPGEQVTTNPKMESIPVKEELTWSRQAVEHVAMLEQATALPAPAQKEPARLEFTAASIRREFIDTHTAGAFNCKGIDGDLFPVTSAYLRDLIPPTPQGRCTSEKIALDAIISRFFSSTPAAFRGGPAQYVVGIPDAMLLPPYFQIHATAENPSRATKAELQQMFQNLLMDRFKLRIRREIRQVDGYILTVAKSGIKFNETSNPETPGLSQGPIAIRGNPRWEAVVPYLESLLGQIAGQWINRPNVGNFIRSVPVDDKTGLKGQDLYNIVINIRRLETTAAVGGAGGRSGGGQPHLELDPPLPKALEEQLGLVLTRGKVPVEYIVVEHIELPSEN